MTLHTNGLAVILAFASCSTSEPAMSAPSPPPTILSAFKQLQGGDGTDIAPGAPLVTLGGRATWWEGDVPVTIALPIEGSTQGARWQADGKLAVGPGALDLKARMWTAEPALAKLRVYRVQHFRSVAWTGDAAHAAVLLQHFKNSQGAPGKQEIVIAARDGIVRGRLDVRAVTEVVASSDRVLLGRAGQKPLVLDLDAKVIAEPNLSSVKVNEGSGMFAVALADRGVALVRPSDGAIVATWDVQAHDAVPVPHGIVAIDDDGVVRVGCVQGNTVRETAQVPSGQKLAIIQHVGDRIAVMGHTMNPVWVATFTNPCR
jgi:hypothetical protein